MSGAASNSTRVASAPDNAESPPNSSEINAEGDGQTADDALMLGSSDDGSGDGSDSDHGEDLRSGGGDSVDSDDDSGEFSESEEASQRRLEHEEQSAKAQAITGKEFLHARWKSPVQKKSPLWKFFLQGADKAHKDLALCKVTGCNKKISAKATTNLKQHMNAKHKKHAPWADFLKQKALQKAGKIPNDSGEIQNYFVADEEARHTRLVLGFIIGGHKPLTVVEEPEFQKMLRGFTKRPNLVVPSRASVGDLLTEKAIVARTGLMDMVKGQQLSLTCDGWTSGNEIPMMAVTAHWIDDAWKMKSACLGAFEVAGSHTGVR